MASRKVLSLPLRTRRVVVCGVAAVVVSGLLVAASPAGATVSPQLTRLGGPGRYETSALVSAAAFAHDQAPDVVVVSGATYPDGLAASALAGELRGPVLLVPPHGPLPVAVTAELHRLGAVRATVVGGTSAVGSDVQSALADLGLTVARISGADRYETAAAVADRLDELTGGAPDLGGTRTAFLATGSGFADALAVSGIAYAGHIPILLSGGGTLDPATVRVLQRYDSVGVLGGVNAISDDVVHQLQELGLSVHRYGGQDRNQTAVLLSHLGSFLGYQDDGLVVVSGTDFPDALAASALAGRTRHPILFSEGRVTDYFARDHDSTVQDLYVIGGDDAQPAARTGQLLDDVTAPDPDLPQLVSSSPQNRSAVVRGDAAVITATFSEPLPVGATGALLDPDLQPVPVTVTVDGATMSLHDVPYLQVDSTYVAVFTPVDAPRSTASNSRYVRFTVLPGVTPF